MSEIYLIMWVWEALTLQQDKQQPRPVSKKLKRMPCKTEASALMKTEVNLDFSKFMYRPQDPSPEEKLSSQDFWLLTWQGRLTMKVDVAKEGTMRNFGKSSVDKLEP